MWQGYFELGLTKFCLAQCLQVERQNRIIMKKLFLIIGFSAFSVAVFSQFTLGVKGGYNTSLGFDKNWEYNNQNWDLKSDLAQGVQLGAFARFGRSFYVQPELTYNFNVSKIHYTGNSQIITDDVILSTLDFPVLLGFKVVNTKLFNLRMMAGPKFRFNVGSDTSIDNVQDILLEARKAQVGLEAGLGIDVWFLSVDVRYNLIQQLYHYKTVDQQEINMDPINAFTVSVGWKLIDIYKPKR